jgi:3',5'-cyclic-AMP phosphodiesterase
MRHLWASGRGLVPAALLLTVACVAVILAAPQDKNNFHFSIVGDRTGSATPEVYARVWREVALLQPDFAINAGDAIEGGNESTAEAEWAHVRSILARYARWPVYFTPGNHDVWSEKSQKLFEKATGRPPYYSFDYQNAHFAVLDNSRTGLLDDSQLRFLEADLKANRARSPKFVFFHKPFWIPFLKVESGEFALHRLAKEYGVNYVVSGHGHQFYRDAREGVTYIEVGSSGAHMRGNSGGQGFEQGWFYHHIWVSVRGAKATFAVKELDGAKGSGRMFDAEQWDGSGPRFPPADPAAAEKLEM